VGGFRLGMLLLGGDWIGHGIWRELWNCVRYAEILQLKNTPRHHECMRNGVPAIMNVNLQYSRTFHILSPEDESQHPACPRPIKSRRDSMVNATTAFTRKILTAIFILDDQSEGAIAFLVYAIANGIVADISYDCISITEDYL
jgi:hypothetical protein